MADAPKILETDSLRTSFPKLNLSIDNSNEALTKATNADGKADNAVTTANQANAKSDTTQQQLDTIIIDSGTSDAETIQARGGEPLLYNRLDKTDAQLAQNATILGEQVGFKDSYIKKNKVSPKLVINSAGIILVVTQKPNGKEYVRFRLQEGVITTTESEGGSAEFLRVNQVLTVAECFTYVSNEKQVSDIAIWGDNTINYVHPVVGSSIPVSCDAVVTKTAGAWIEYDVTVPFGVNEVTSFIYGSTGSSENINISVDGVDVLTGVSFRKATGGFFFLTIPIKTSGSHTIRFTTTTADYMTIAGVNVVHLKDFKDGYNFDSNVVVHQTDQKQYVQANGAMDYALLKDDGIWTGSYHGGEIRNRLLFLLDGEATVLNDGDMHICNIFEIEQDTRISNKIDAYSRQIFESDATRELEVVFGNGSINLQRMFVNMSTTKDTYDDIIYPIRFTLVDEGNKYLPSGVNTIIQRDPSNNQKAITIINNCMYPPDQLPAPYIKKSTGAYNKVYNANIDILGSSIAFTGGNFRVAHSFE